MNRYFFALLAFFVSISSARGQYASVILQGIFTNGEKLKIVCKEKGYAVAGVGKIISPAGEKVLVITGGNYSKSQGVVQLSGKFAGTQIPFQVQGAVATGKIALTVPGQPVALAQGSVFLPEFSVQEVDQQLAAVLQTAGFTGNIQQQLEPRLGRKVNWELAQLGRWLFFDSILALGNDNSCAGCHSPLRGFGDTQPISIGVQNNGIVGPGRKGPRNQRRAPMMLNTAFYPNLMWNSRIIALSGNPFDNRDGFSFPPPEGLTLSYLPNLLTAQVFLPVTERMEMAGFTFVDDSHDAMRKEILRRLNLVPSYRFLFGKNFPPVKAGGPISFDMVGLAIAEFGFTLVRANAPLDRFARGQAAAMTRSQKEGAMVFFGKARCVSCHAVAGSANEMFSDFKPHAIGVPQIVPKATNAKFDGAGNEDFGFEQVSKNAADRYKFRTAPLRNVGLQPYFFHDGAFDRLEDAILHHLNVPASALNYSPAGRLPPDLAGPTGPILPILQQLDPLLAQPIVLSPREFHSLVDFVRFGLLDPAAAPLILRQQIPAKLPSGNSMPVFQ